MEKLFQFSFSLLTEADTRKSTGNEEKPHKPRERKKFLSYQQQYNKHKLFDEIYKNLLTFFFLANYLSTLPCWSKPWHALQIRLATSCFEMGEALLCSLSETYFIRLHMMFATRVEISVTKWKFVTLLWWSCQWKWPLQHFISHDLSQFKCTAVLNVFTQTIIWVIIAMR